MRNLKALLPTILAGILPKSTAFPPSQTTARMASTTTTSSPSSALHVSKVIDSHLHIWATPSESSTTPYAPNHPPPPSLLHTASTSALLQKMKTAKVDGALIVQPINHLFDHRYVADAIQSHPGKLKGMMLHDPSLTARDAVERLEDLALRGFVGVRFNPYLWPAAAGDAAGGGGGMCVMSKEGQGGLAVYKRCGELNFPVGVMCFKGLDLHYDDIIHLLEASPTTTLILDHLGFTALDAETDDNFTKLLSLAKYQKVVVKLSALFRVAGANDPYPYERVRTERFVPLLRAFGKDRIMFGTDFPFITEQEGDYDGAVALVTKWAGDEETRDAVMGGTAERLFGLWG